MTAVTLASRGAYAKMHGVSKAAVGKWEKRGILVIVDGKVNVEASDRRAMHAGVGRFGHHRPAPPVPPPAPDDLPPAALLLRHFINRIAAHGALVAWEVGATLEQAQEADPLFRVSLMDAAAILLTDMGATPPAGSVTWADCEMWDTDKMAVINWTACEAMRAEEANAEG